MTFSESLISLRNQRGLSQEQLGAEIGVTRQTVSKWELGGTTPEMDKLIQLSEFFDISIDELVGREHWKDDGLSYIDEDGIPANRQDMYWCHRYRWHYEYKSQRTFMGLPLVHINVGNGLHKAKGVIAIGNIARGLISIGAVSMGVFSLGALSVGALSLGAASVGMLLSVGGISIGALAVGGFALGIFAMGGCAIGMYSVGGCAIAAKIAAGGYAHAPIAIGDRADGAVVFSIKERIAQGAIRSAILERFPRTWEAIVGLFEVLS